MIFPEDTRCQLDWNIGVRNFVSLRKSPPDVPECYHSRTTLRRVIDIARLAMYY